MRINRSWMVRLVSVALLYGAMAGTAYATPKIHHWTEPNGARVYYVEAREIPMLQLSVVFDAGAARDPAGKNGLALLSNALLKEGAGSLDATQIAATFEDVGAQYSSDSQRDMAVVSLRTLADPALRERALGMMATLLKDPKFPQPSLDRERKRALVSLKQSSQSPGTIVAQRFYKTLYRDHPYANDPNGDEAGLNAVTRDDLVAYHKQYYVGNNAVVALIGDVGLAAAKQIVQKVVGELPAGEAAAPIPDVPALAADVGNKPIRVNFPSSQSHIYMGEPAITRTEPDYFSLYVGNHILGGSGLVSRISNEIREKRGLSYSAYSYFIPMRQRGPYLLGLQTRNDKADEALKVLRETVERFVAEGPSEAELEAAKKNLTGGFPLRIDSNKDIVEYLAVIGFYRLPLTYLDDFIPQINAVTVESVKKAFERHVHPQRMVTVIVGGGGR